MSKIALQGDASGTGTFTIASPNSNTDRTLTLPDEAGTVLTNGGAIDVDASAPADSLAIDASGNVAIGHTTTGGANFAICDGANSQIQFFAELTTDTNLIQHYDPTATAYINADYRAATHQFKIGTSEAMRIESDGDVAMGTTTTGPRLAISDSRTNNYAVKINCSRGSGETGFLVQFTENTPAFSNSVGSIRSNGSSVSYLTTSDYRAKENVVDMTGAIDRVKSLAPKRFNFIGNEDGTVVDGFLAHEAQEVVPEAVSGTKDAMRTEDVLDEEGNVVGTKEVPEYQGIDQSKLVPLLTAALQEAIGRIETLEAEVAELKGASA
jgi:hypothetical protein